MGGGCSTITGVEFANKGRQINCHGTIITFPKKFTWILFSHGDKTNKSPTRGGELTPLGRKQVWDTTWQHIEKFGQETMEKITILYSPVHRVKQSRDIFMAAIGISVRYANIIECVPLFEWGPGNGHKNDAYAIEKMIEHSIYNDIIVALGHNGLWEHIAEITYPCKNGYSLPVGAAFIITEREIEMITPNVTA